ncbi:MAG: GNAT family N-acetyltransferase [Acidimicrobiales bacterium]|jgi:GNAT superfamily N-acetyltransferase|nr:GNAT family N-acetyltransferase [Acidimicrobiales bacterium]MDP6901226.1 GNAT family N-acetyltransferase [Acidimicrobiales bacterium]HJM00158.1 GNAT family N-acetyltransferase [Acidimicrobiales bacterium]
MKEGVRFATLEDLDALEEFAAQAVEEQVDNKGGAVWSKRDTRSQPYRASLEAAFNDPDQDLWVGLIDDVPVGYAAARAEILRTGEILGIVSDLWVEPGAREVGVGEALINEIIIWCKERHCIGIDSLALPGNRATKNFFETFGFKARLLTVHHPLDTQ